MLPKRIPTSLQGSLKNWNNTHFPPPFFAQLPFSLINSGAWTRKLLTMMNLLNFPYNLHDMIQDEEETHATDTTSPHCNWTGKEQMNTANEQIVENPPHPDMHTKPSLKARKSVPKKLVKPIISS